MPAHGYPTIKADKPAVSMPQWAVLERSLISLMNESVDLLLDQFLTPEGELFWPDMDDFQTYAYSNVDNAFEGFHSWPLFYALGGADRFLQLAHRQHEALIRQFSQLKKHDLGIDEQYAARTGRDTLLVDEYLPDIDWMHQGEAAQLFYLLNMADPGHERNRERSLRFAGFFTGESASLPGPNYDPAHRVFRSSLIGSNGPAFCKFDRPYAYSSWMEPYGLAFYDVPGVQTMLDLKDADKAARYGKVYGDRLRHADTVTNLMATSMALNAYMHTGEEKYRSWALDYIGGWRERYAACGGAMPDNAGPSGAVGETMDGKWYGGHYGWTFPHGFQFIGDALVIAGQNERLLTGRKGRLDWLREQLAMLMGHAVKDERGSLLLPQKYADPHSVIEYAAPRTLTRPDRATDKPGFARLRQIGGWYEFRTQNAAHPAHLYMDTFAPQDMELLERLRDRSDDCWNRVSAKAVNAKTMGGQYNAYVSYLNGGYPDYPVDVLMHSFNQVYGQLNKLRGELRGAESGWGYPPDNEREYEELREVTRQINGKYGRRFSESTVHSYFQTFLLYRSTVTTEALVHLTMGGLSPVYNGGLLNVSVRYFDAARRRPGLPEDTAALVSVVRADELALSLCNLHPHEPRTVVVQAGAFGEHSFVSADVVGGEGASATVPVNGRWFAAQIGPGCMIELRVGLRRFVNRPSYEGPFDRAGAGEAAGDGKSAGGEAGRTERASSRAN